MVYITTLWLSQLVPCIGQEFGYPVNFSGQNETGVKRHQIAHKLCVLLVLP